LSLHKVNNTSLSPIEFFSFGGRSFYVKRDDLIDPHLSGNKYRKLYALLNTPSSHYKRVVSYGGTQSNAMLAIAALCREKGWEFIYYTKPLHVKETDHASNYGRALALGMKHVELDSTGYHDFIASLAVELQQERFLLHQGGADKSAAVGVKELANEIRDAGISVKSIATPAGTGTTALYLALFLPEFTVYTTPAVGSAEYLLKQMQALHEIPKNLVILETEKKYRFGNLYKEFLQTYEDLKAGGIEFDLLYAPKLWQLLLTQTDEPVLYIHSGGCSGNTSMLKRYREKGLIPV
jgi:1-aminocyclopropane-1-carboxylate deaminase